MIYFGSRVRISQSLSSGSPVINSGIIQVDLRIQAMMRPKVSNLYRGHTGKLGLIVTVIIRTHQHLLNSDSSTHLGSNAYLVHTFLAPASPMHLDSLLPRKLTHKLCPGLGSTVYLGLGY